jgi:LacI family transcriptional regulator
VLLHDLQGEYFAELIRGIDVAARAHRLHLLISTSHTGSEEADEALRAMTGRVDGLILMAPHIDVGSLQKRLQGTLPVVFVSTVDADHTHSSVCVDNAGGASAMVAHLAACGHRTIAHIAGPAAQVDAQERLRGYRDALARERPGVEEYVLHGNFTEDSGYRAGCEILARPQRPDAVFAANDMMAIGCLNALLEAGVRVPHDIALAGFDDIPTARYISPPLTTVRAGIADLGGRALERLVQIIDRPQDAQPSKEVVAAELVIRASCGAAGNGKNADK